MPAITIRTATDDDFETICDFDGKMFSEEWPPEQRALLKPTLEMDRFRLAHDGGNVVGVAGNYTQELTVPGGSILPAGGVTWVAVAPTHRRQGILTALMERLHEDIDARNEPVAMLTASEGGIYERFGYGVATQWRVLEIDRRRTQVRAEHQPTPGTVMLTTSDDQRLIEIFDRYRQQRPGEIRRSPDRFALSTSARGKNVMIAIHADGYAAWKVTPKWNDGYPAHELQLYDLVAITAEAHAALWHTVLSVDLVGLITATTVLAVDDPLPYLLTDQRSVRTTNLNDMLWLSIRDITRTLAARTYGVDDQMVIEVEGAGRWRIDGSPEGAEARKVRSKPDLTMSRATLGAIYLGGFRPSMLVRAAKIKASTIEAVRRADAFFATDRIPHCSTGF
jgi:predicted acetyltransferase